VVEPPSRRLQQILLGLKLCSPRDLRRCASRVKALSADLPAFDSVWLDALVQRRLLTSWQAQTIEAEQPELLRIGPCVVEDRIGQSHRSATYLARLPAQQGQCVIKRVVVPSELRKTVNDRLKQLIEKSSGLAQSGIIVPHSVSEVPYIPLPELASSEKLKESAATRASRQTSTVSSSKKPGTKAGVGRARHKTRSIDQERSDKLNTELAIVSRWVDGLSLSEILLRRGRLPAADVDAIARQLLESLAALHEAGIVHGEILLRNIRLLPSGQAVLVDAGIRPALQPELQISAHVSPEKYDGIAPELIGTGAPVTPRSDLYALGFALWQVLAGRPAFPTGDPLAKLAAHQTERLPDIREFAPDTPDRLARTIEWLTEPTPSRRPRNSRELLFDGTRQRAKPGRQDARQPEKGTSRPAEGRQTKTAAEKALSTQAFSLKPAGRSSRRRLARFASGFQQPVRRSSQSSSTRRTVTSLACACAAVLVAVTALLTFDANARNLVLTRLPQRFVESVTYNGSTTDEASTVQHSTGQPSGSEDSADSATAMKPASGSDAPSAARLHQAPQQSANPTARQNPHPATRAHDLLPLPEPDPYGLVLLSEPGSYDASSIKWPGSHLIIRGMAGVPATIFVSTRPLHLRATEVTLENVELRWKPASTASPASVSQIQSQKLTCRNCRFLTPLSSVTHNGRPTVSPAISFGLAIQWAPIDASDPLAGNLEFINCQLVGSHSSIMLAAPGQKVRCVNTLKLGGGPLFIATDRAAGGDNTFEIEQTTLRDCGSLIAIDLRNTDPWKSRLTIRPVSSVFDLRSRSENESESLITFVGGRLQLAWHERVSFEGDDSVAGSFVGLASWQAGNGSGHQALDAAEVSVRGLMQTEFTFQGSPSQTRANSILTGTQTNRLSSQLPGISNDSGGDLRIPDEDVLLINPDVSPNL
jgi:eukaryotic-like serine/threonine-protein kinase